MFRIKKPAIIMVLIGLLVFTGYINHNLTQQALSKVSTDYQKHEEMQLGKEVDEDDKDLVETLSEGDTHNDIEDDEDDEDDIEILDTKDNQKVDEISKETDKTIEKNIGQGDSLKSKNYFIEQRLARDRLRANSIDRLNEIVNNDNTNNEMRTNAQEKIMNIGNISETELAIEGLVKAKGFEEALAFFTDKDIKIVVSKDELSEQDMVKILNLVMGETNLDASNIKIMNKH